MQTGSTVKERKAAKRGLTLAMLNRRGSDPTRRRAAGIAMPEIIIIIALIIILAMLSYPKYYQSLTKAARDTNMVASAALVKALKLYKLDNRDFPPADTSVSALDRYTNITHLKTAYTTVTLTVTGLGGGGCVHGVSAKVEGEYHIVFCADIEGLASGGYCCWKDFSGTDCNMGVVGDAPPYFPSPKWYECKTKL